MANLKELEFAFTKQVPNISAVHSLYGEIPLSKDTLKKIELLLTMVIKIEIDQHKSMLANLNMDNVKKNHYH